MRCYTCRELPEAQTTSQVQQVSTKSKRKKNSTHYLITTAKCGLMCWKKCRY